MGRTPTQSTHRPGPARVQPAYSTPRFLLQFPQRQFAFHWPLKRKGTILLGSSLVGLALWEADPVLCLATISGIGTLLLVQRGQPHWQLGLTWAWTLAAKLWKLSQEHPFVLAGLAAMAATSGTYVALKVWQASPNAWVGLGLLAQGLGLLLILGLLLGLIRQQQLAQQESRWQNLLVELTHPQALRRYLAIRQLGQLALSATQTTVVQESLLLLLAEERETKVKQAALEMLRFLPKSEAFVGIEPREQENGARKLKIDQNRVVNRIKSIDQCLDF